MTHLTCRKFASALSTVSAAVLAMAACVVGSSAQTPTPTPAPQKQEEVVRVETELVQTDVSVFDREGKFVEGLGREQFEVKVDGRVVPVAFFERAGAGALKGGPGAAAARLNTRGRRVAFFLDDVHLSPDSLERVRKTNDFKFNVNLVILDFAVRSGLIAVDDPEYLDVATGLHRPLD